MSKSCIHEGCLKIPSFNFQNNKIRLYCNDHKKENMINVKNKTCIEEKL